MIGDCLSICFNYEKFYRIFHATTEEGVMNKVINELRLKFTCGLFFAKGIKRWFPSFANFFAYEPKVILSTNLTSDLGSV
jgi:hypothetical protein